jgi:hypothetical protein
MLGMTTVCYRLAADVRHQIRETKMLRKMTRRLTSCPACGANVGFAARLVVSGGHLGYPCSTCGATLVRQKRITFLEFLILLVFVVVMPSAFSPALTLVERVGTVCISLALFLLLIEIQLRQNLIVRK